MMRSFQGDFKLSAMSLKMNVCRYACTLVKLLHSSILEVVSNLVNDGCSTGRTHCHGHDGPGNSNCCHNKHLQKKKSFILGNKPIIKPSINGSEKSSC